MFGDRILNTWSAGEEKERCLRAVGSEGTGGGMREGRIKEMLRAPNGDNGFLASALFTSGPADSLLWIVLGTVGR